MTPAAGRSSARQSNRVGSAVRTGWHPHACTLLRGVARCCCLPPSFCWHPPRWGGPSRNRRRRERTSGPSLRPRRSVSEHVPSLPTRRSQSVPSAVPTPRSNRPVDAAQPGTGFFVGNGIYPGGADPQGQRQHPGCRPLGDRGSDGAARGGRSLFSIQQGVGATISGFKITGMRGFRRRNPQPRRAFPAMP